MEEVSAEREVARSVVGVIDDTTGVQRVLSQLAEMDITSDEVSVMMRDGSGPIEPSSPQSRVTGGAATGAAFGGLLGGLAGWMIAIGALVVPGVLVPGVGLVFGAGTLASLLTGMAVGAAAGGLVGALLGLGVPEDEAKEYERQLTRGRALVTVHVPPSLDPIRVAEVLQTNGAYDVRLYETPREPDEEPNALDEAAEPLRPALDEVSAAEEATAAAAVHANDMAAQEQAQEAGEQASLIENLPPTAEGDVSAETDALGSGAAGGHGTGEARGQQPEPRPESELQSAAEPREVSQAGETAPGPVLMLRSRRVRPRTPDTGGPAPAGDPIAGQVAEAGEGDGGSEQGTLL